MDRSLLAGSGVSISCAWFGRREVCRLLYAVVSDLHANLPALEAVLADIERRTVDQIVCLGDVVGYNAHPNECADIIREHGIPTIMGNHDEIGRASCRERV